MSEPRFKYQPAGVGVPVQPAAVERELAKIAAVMAADETPRAVMTGIPSGFNLGTTQNALVNYANAYGTGVMMEQADTTLGQIKIPVTGLYSVEGWALGGMVSPSSGGQWAMELGRTPGGYTIIDGKDIGSIVPMLNRTVGQQIKIELNAGDVIWLALSGTVAMGAFTFGLASFSAELIHA